MKKNDHGLDFHLRSLDICIYQVGQIVSQILEKVGLAVE
jgi:hypothetical protein